jgi:hypothetical protein
MTFGQGDYRPILRRKIAEEGTIQQRTDPAGKVWRKVYSGGGDHYRSWLAQCREVYGEENVLVEEVDSAGWRCYDESGEKLYRIWVRVKEL